MYIPVWPTPLVKMQNTSITPESFLRPPSSQSQYSQAIIVLIPLTIDACDHVFEFYINWIIYILLCKSSFSNGIGRSSYLQITVPQKVIYLWQKNNDDDKGDFLRISSHTLVYCKDNTEDSGISIIKKLLVTLNQCGWGMLSVWSHLYGANYLCHTGMDLCVESDFFFKDHSFQFGLHRMHLFIDCLPALSHYYILKLSSSTASCF